MRVLKYHIKRTHPDWSVVQRHCTEARRLYNGMNALARESQRMPDNLPMSDIYNMRPWVESHMYLGSLGAFTLPCKQVIVVQDIKLPAKVAQGVARKLSQDWKSVFALRKKGLIAGDVRYKKHYGLVEYNPQTLSTRALKKGYIKPTDWTTGVRLPEHIFYRDIQSARLYHSHKDVFVFEVLYHEQAPCSTTGDIAAAIDLGINKLATIVFEDGRQPLAVNGLEVKSVNQGANRNNKLKEVKNKQGMWAKRTRRVNHYLHSASSAVVHDLCKRGVGELIIGWNEGFKDSPTMGRKGNQRFVSMPLARFRDMLTYKAEAQGITVTIQEESYTSKASFIDNDALPCYPTTVKKFSGRRVKRGLYKSLDGTLIHADVNGAYNILRKRKPSFGWRRGFVVKPANLAFSY